MRSVLRELAVYLETFVLGELEISLRERRRVRPVPIDVLVAFSSARADRGAAVDRANRAARGDIRGDCWRRVVYSG